MRSRASRPNLQDSFSPLDFLLPLHDCLQALLKLFFVVQMNRFDFFLPSSLFLKLPLPSFQAYVFGFNGLVLFSDTNRLSFKS